MFELTATASLAAKGITPADFMEWLRLALSLVGAASAIAALTPTPRDDGLAGRLYKVIDVLALNIGFAKDRACRAPRGTVRELPRPRSPHERSD